MSEAPWSHTCGNTAITSHPWFAANPPTLRSRFVGIRPRAISTRQVISGADAVINLNGRSISQGRWTPAVKDELRSSRLDATRTIVDAIGRAEVPPPLLINASATGFLRRPG